MRARRFCQAASALLAMAALTALACGCGSVSGAASGLGNQLTVYSSLPLQGPSGEVSRQSVWPARHGAQHEPTFSRAMRGDLGSFSGLHGPAAASDPSDPSDPSDSIAAAGPVLGARMPDDNRVA